MIDEPSYEDTALAGTPYREVGKVARGAVGEVVEAEHRALGKRVVVKLLRRDLAERADLMDRMRIEAQTLSRLDHPNLVSALDFGETAEGRTYLVMERLVGRTFEEELRARGALPPWEAAKYVIDALAGLDAAHTVGVVHRDLKPDNLLLAGPAEGLDRTVKVLDFGLAKVLPSAASAAPAPLAIPTEDNRSLGTPRFFSPEQARREPVDARSDIYGMGLVLYALIAGRGPFDDATSLADLLIAHAEAIPEAPSKYARFAVGPALDALILRALAKDPAARFARASDFARALTPFATPPRPSEEGPDDIATTRVREVPDDRKATLVRDTSDDLVATRPLVRAKPAPRRFVDPFRVRDNAEVRARVDAAPAAPRTPEAQTATRPPDTVGPALPATTTLPGWFWAFAVAIAVCAAIAAFLLLGDGGK